ncbi:MAG: molecular chaperone DnaJ [Deltaproteobacteria bacterium]|nr:molecular chaperone DnaJ [Deltaproteobacteria bacterium]
MAAEKDLYAALGVAKTATADEIKKAYRKLARKHHPDVNPGNRAAEEKFKAISEANDILGDPEKRKLYDEFGMAGVQSGFDADQARAYRDQAASWQRRGGGRGSDGGDFAGGFGGYENLDDIFGDIFGQAGRGAGGGGGGMRGGFGGQMAGGDAESEMTIDLLDAVRGLSTAVSIQRQEECPTCHGSGADPATVVSCPECKGKGRVQVAQGPMQFTRTCPRCGGSGQTSSKPCATCNGAGARLTTERLNVHIPAGVDSGSRVRVAGKGSPGHNGGPAGDLYIRVTVRPHPLLERRGDDLHMDLPVTVSEAVVGASVEVPTPDGAVRVKIPAHSQSGRQLRVKERGVPHLRGGGRGDLYLRLVVQPPDREAEAAADAARALDAYYTRSPREGLRL